LILAGVTIAMLTGNNGILTKVKEAKEKTKQAEQEEIYALENVLNSINSSAPSTDGYNESKQVNSPKITQGMIPVKWNGTNWQVCSQDDNEWYSYTNKDKKWANIMLSDGTYKSDTVNVGQVVKDDELGSMYVWIPRYAYTVDNTSKKMNVTFVKGNTNEGVNGETFTTDESVDTKTTKLVHPGFNLGGTALTGIWVAKFEASGTDKNGNAVGNATSTSNEEQYHPDETTIAKSLPNKISWRHITIGESEKRSMDITTTDKDKFGINYASSHLIKNSEWGAVAYLSYSEYGKVPMINGVGTYTDNWWYNFYTGQGPQSPTNEDCYNYDISHNYNTSIGQLASTTWNTTGIYDMSGGSNEKVAAYLDNNNGNLNTFGQSTDGIIKYFENKQLKKIYTNLWDKYEVSEEEKNNKIKIEEIDTLTQNELWQWDKQEKKYQIARQRLTMSNYNNMAKHKGIAINEVNINGISFYAPGKSTDINPTPWLYYKTIEQSLIGTQNYYSCSWDDDFVLVGYAACPFLLRGGYPTGNSHAGILAYNITYGHANNNDGFRSVIVI
ncbi:MAG: hypothetical protein ACLS59_10375, partial [Clostridia bacterium]